jgi:hypothetical protein
MARIAWPVASPAYPLDIIWQDALNAAGKSR